MLELSGIQNNKIEQLIQRFYIRLSISDDIRDET